MGYFSNSFSLGQIFVSKGEDFMDRIFAHSITFFREEKHLTQTLAAELSGIDQSQFSRIEGGENWPNKATLNKICRGMKISSREFFENMGQHLIDAAKRGELLFPFEENEKEDEEESQYE
jgi:transcriptional regulator with XRE-family HTH domain